MRAQCSVRQVFCPHLLHYSYGGGDGSKGRRNREHPEEEGSFKATAVNEEECLVCVTHLVAARREPGALNTDSGKRYK